jgi:hypothetical protein
MNGPERSDESPPVFSESALAAQMARVLWGATRFGFDLIAFARFLRFLVTRLAWWEL